MTIEEAANIIKAHLPVSSNALTGNVRTYWASVEKAMRVHFEGLYPSHLIDNKRPNEPDEIKEFRRKNYEPITVSVFEAARNGLYRIFADAGDAISVSEDLDAYINANNFSGTDFMSWIQTHLVPRMLVDPNGWAVVIPDGGGLRDPNQRVNPRLELLHSSRIFGWGSDWLLWQGYEVDETYDRQRNVFWMITTTELYRIVENRGTGEAVYEVELAFAHNAQVLPAVQLGGIPKYTPEGNYYYDSWFAAAVPFANEVIKQYSDWYAALTTASYAIRELRAVECTAPGCRGGKIYDPNDPLKEIGTCNVCHGTGFVPDSSPYGVYLQSRNAFDPEGGRPPVVFHTPPVEPLQYAERAWQQMYDRLKEALHLKFIDEAQSGVAKQIDREAAYAQLLRISNHVWDSIIWSLLNAMERMRNRINPRVPSVVKPTEFAMRTESDLVDEVSRLRQSNMPPDFVSEVMRELLKKRYAGDELIQKKHAFLMMTDPLYDAPPQMEAFYFNAGIVTREQVAYSIHAAAILDQLIKETRPDPLVLFYDTDKLRRIIEDRIQRILPAIPVVPMLG